MSFHRVSFSTNKSQTESTAKSWRGLTAGPHGVVSGNLEASWAYFVVEKMGWNGTLCNAAAAGRLWEARLAAALGGQSLGQREYSTWNLEITGEHGG